MTPFSKAALIFVTTTAGALTSLVAWSHDWHFWPVPMLVPVAVGLILGTDRGDRAPGPVAAGPIAGPGLSPSQIDHREHSVSIVPVPSSAPDYAFLFSATVRWRLLPTAVGSVRRPANANPGALAIDTILARVRQVTATEPPHEFALAQHRLGITLGVVGTDPSGQVEAWATNVALTLSADDLQRQRKIADLRKDEAIWEHEREYERSRRTYLSDDVLRTTGSAVVWWLAKKEDAVERTVDLIGPLAQLAAAANDREVPELFRHLIGSATGPADAGEDDGLAGTYAQDSYPVGPSPRSGFGAGADGSAPFEPESPAAEKVAELIDQFGLKPSTEKRDFFVRRLADLFTQLGQHDAAHEVRAAFGTADLNAPDPAVSAMENESADEPEPGFDSFGDEEQNPYEYE